MPDVATPHVGRRWGQALTNARKTQCLNGHDLAVTAYHFRDALGRPHRQCRVCRDSRARFRRNRNTNPKGHR